MFPIFKNKYKEKSIVNPLDYVNENRKNFQKIPENIIIIYDYAKSIFSEILKERGLNPIKNWNIYFLNENLGVYISSIGAPFVTVNMENFIVMGAKNFLNIGIAGGLSEKMKAGDIVICEKALRDEGVSYHYLKPSKYSYPDKKALMKIEKIFEFAGVKFSKGATWTIDAPYRETKKEVIKYSKEGILTVDMEASAIFAVAKYRKVKAASIFIISDILTENGWRQYFNSKAIDDSLKKILKIFLDNFLEI